MSTGKGAWRQEQKPVEECESSEHERITGKGTRAREQKPVEEHERVREKERTCARDPQNH